MTTLNTIIEEEEKFDVVDWLRNTYGLDDDDCLSAGRVQELCEMLVFDVRTTVRQRAYEVGRQSVLDEWKEEQKKFTEGFAYRKP